MLKRIITVIDHETLGKVKIITEKKSGIVSGKIIEFAEPVEAPTELAGLEDAVEKTTEAEVVLDNFTTELSEKKFHLALREKKHYYVEHSTPIF